MTFELGIQHHWFGSYKIYSDDDPGLTLTYSWTQYIQYMYIGAKTLQHGQLYSQMLLYGKMPDFIETTGVYMNLKPVQVIV